MKKLRSAFTLVELFVVIAIIAAIFAMLLPAIMKVREASNRVICANNLRQFGLGLHAYANQKGRLPPGGLVRNWPREDAHKKFNDTTLWMENQGSWLLHTLPYLESGNLYSLFSPYLKADKWNGDKPDTPGGCGFFFEYCDIRRANNGDWFTIQSPAYMRCPSYNHDWVREPACNYAGSIGPQCIFGPCGYDTYIKYCDQPEYGFSANKEIHDRFGDSRDLAEVRGCFNRIGVRVRLKDITDGFSTTILLGEFSPSEHDHALGSGLHYLEATGHWADADAGYGHVHTLVPINYRTNIQTECNSTPQMGPGTATTDEEVLSHSWQNWHLSWGFKSRHPGGANFLFADGSVHYLGADINHQLYQMLGCRNDGQPYTMQSDLLPRPLH